MPPASKTPDVPRHLNLRSPLSISFCPCLKYTIIIALITNLCLFLNNFTCVFLHWFVESNDSILFISYCLSMEDQPITGIKVNHSSLVLLGFFGWYQKLVVVATQQFYKIDIILLFNYTEELLSFPFASRKLW